MKGCAVRGCRQRHCAKGYCKDHHRRLVKYGDPTAPSLSRVHLPTAPLREVVVAFGKSNVPSRYEQESYSAPRYIAEKLGVGPRAVNLLLRKDTISMAQADRIATALGCHPITIWPDFHRYAEETA